MRPYDDMDRDDAYDAMTAEIVRLNAEVARLTALLTQARDEEDAVWAQRGGWKRCRCGHWTNSPACQHAHAQEA